VAESLPDFNYFKALTFYAAVVPVLSAVCLSFSSILAFTAFYFSKSFYLFYSVAFEPVAPVY
jgi:hypothetical protein